MNETPKKIAELLNGKDIIVCAGTGGVGKTTASAAIALHEALRGKKVLVLTIDPARRLADAIGIQGMGSGEVRIPLDGLNAEGDGELWAMMLESKRAFDQMVERYASSPEAAQVIFNNPVYQHVSGALSGSQEYMAIEKLSELHGEKKYDLIVLDTPPSANALDFFTAPERMMAFLDHSVLQWFLKPYLTISRIGMKSFKMTSRAFLRVVEKLLGGQIIQDVLDFFEGFDGMYEGFRQRAETVDRVLRRSRTAFVLVATPSRMTLEDARIFMEKLKSMGMPLVSVVINRATLPPEGMDLAFLDKGPEILQTIIDETGAHNNSEKSMAQNMFDNALNYRELISREIEDINKFGDRIGNDLPIFVVPMLEEDVHNLEGLNRLGDALYRGDRL